MTAFVERRDVLSWGRVVRQPQRVASPRFGEELPALVSEAGGETLLPAGLLRSYGDSALNSEGLLISMTGLDRFVALDTASGTLRAEAGVSMDEIMRRVVPHGFFPAVTPGTRFVTLGGAIANDVHGKNHHWAGTFGRHVTSFKLLRSNGDSLTVKAKDSNGLFEATIGGLGVTGIIEWADIELQRIESSFLDAEIIPYDTLSEFWEIAEASTATHEHTVAWIDCTGSGRHAGRGIFSRANWCKDGVFTVHSDRQRLGVPADAPAMLLNGFTVKLFNKAYDLSQRRKTGHLRQHYSQFFHPLDRIPNWNRLYGRKGFWQYQCAVPSGTMRAAIAELLKKISKSGQGSFLAVLKTFGNLPSPGLLSFPMEGATLALDFSNRGTRTLALFSTLDAVVREAGGRLYAAKDGRVPKEVWASGYPRLAEFLHHADPGFSSDFWRRVAP